MVRMNSDSDIEGVQPWVQQSGTAAASTSRKCFDALLEFEGVMQPLYNISHDNVVSVVEKQLGK